MPFSKLTLKLAKAVDLTWAYSIFYGRRCHHCDGRDVFNHNDEPTFIHEDSCPANYAEKILSMAENSS